MNLFFFEGHFLVAEYLVESGCNKDKADIYGVCPLHMASMSGYLNTVKLLFSGNYHCLIIIKGGSDTSLILEWNKCTMKPV